MTAELSRLSSENARLREELASQQRLTDGPKENIQKTIKILRANNRKMAVRHTADWTTAKRFEKNLADIFVLIAPLLLSENNTIEMSTVFGVRTIGQKYYPKWPVAKNTISGFVADFAALELVEPSKKKHSLKDTNEYWSLTKFGGQVLREFRRIRLEGGLQSVPQPLSADQPEGVPEEENNQTSELTTTEAVPTT